MAELQRKKQKSVGTVCKDAIMTGISYMIPVIVGGGVITAIAKMMGGYNIGDTAAEMQTLAQVIVTIGNNLFAFAVPCLAAFIAYAIADKPGIAPGYAMGVLAGLMKTGFVGGLVGALIAGWFVLQMKKIKVPKALQGIMPIMFIPVLSTLIVGLLMWYVIGVPIAWLMGIVTGWLTALSAGSRFVLGAVIGAMIAFDNGGPVNKTAALFVNGLNADGFFIPTDLMRHATNASIATLKENPQIDYMDLCIAVEDAMKDFIKSYMRVIGSSGRYSFEKHNGPELD